MKTNKLFKIFGIFLLLFGTLSLTGCGSKNKALSEKELIEILPKEITSYELDGEIHAQKVKELDVIKRKIDEKSDFVECCIVLQDKNLLRTVYADLYLSYYEIGGWLIDSWGPYDEENVQPVLPPDPKVIRQLAENEYSDITEIGSDDSQLAGGIFTTSFDVDEKHSFVTFTGNITCESILRGYEASKKEMAYYYWDNNLQRDMKTIWDIKGEYLLTESNDNLPDKIYVSIDSYDPQSKKVHLTAYEAYPAHHGSDYLGYYGSYTNTGYTYASEYGKTASDASLEIRPFSTVSITFCADKIIPQVNNLTNHKYSIIRVETKEIYDKWNDFPKGSEYSFPISR